MSTPLRELLNGLLLDPTSRSAFEADPERFLADNGWADLDGHDVEAALGALVHELPVEQAVRIAPVVADGAVFDDPGLRGAIAGLGAATAAFDVPMGDLPAELEDPADALDELGSTGAPTDDAGDDPAAGIDADDDSPPEATGAADDGTAWDDGDEPAWSGTDDEGSPATPDDGAVFDDDDDSNTFDTDAALALDDGFGESSGFQGVDDADALDGGGGLAPYDPTEGGADVDEPDDGLPY